MVVAACTRLSASNPSFFEEESSLAKMVTFPKEQAGGKPADDPQNEMDQMILTRKQVENVRRWIDDPDREVMFNMNLPHEPGPRLDPAQIEDMDKAGVGVFGHTTIIEPADYKLYESYIFRPLRNPDEPKVMISVWDMNTPTPLVEARVMIRVLCPDGIDSWLVICAPAPSFHTALEGNILGWPNCVADEMSVNRDRSEVIYEGEVGLSMEFKSIHIDDAAVTELKRSGNEFGNTVSFVPSGGRTCLVRQGTGDPEPGIHFAEWETGMIQTYSRPEDPWSGLIPANGVTPGMWQRFYDTGDNPASGMYKIKGV